MIKSNEISIVVQGAINKTETLASLKNIRKYLPDSEVILSTWEGSDVSFLDGLYDILILNKDPGAGYYYKTDKEVKYNNLNRQLVSTQEGLKRATKKYAMKVRSDIILTSDKFLNFFDKYPKRNGEYKLFEHKIIASAVCSRFVMNDCAAGNRIDETKMAFHVSDWWFFGLKNDLELYFGVPLVQEPEFSNFYKLEQNKDKFNPYIYLEESYVQFSPEQYYAIKSFQNKFNNIKIEHAGDVSDEQFEFSRKLLANNFIFLEYCDSGVYFKKHAISKYPWLSPAYLDLYNKYRQEYEYRINCNSEHQISNFTEYILTDTKLKKDIRNLLIHFHRAIGRKSYNSNITIEIFITAYLLIIFLLKHIYFLFFLFKETVFKNKTDQ